MSYENITVNTQSSIRIEGSKIVYFDPYRITDKLHDADIICITHSHYDHFDPDSIWNVSKPETVFAAPKTMASDMEKVADSDRLFLLSPGEDLQIGEISISTVPSYNKLKPFHPKHEQFLGYILAMDGRRYYIAGDTDAIKDIQGVECDVALVPIGGKFTMNAKDAAGLINKIRPAVAIPIHYGSIVGKPGDADVFSDFVDPDIEVVKKLSF